MQIPDRDPAPPRCRHASRAPLLAALLLLACGGEGTATGPAPALADAPAHDAAPAPRAPEVPEDAPRVVVLGDSIAAGLHLAADRAFPAVLARRAAEQGLPFHLVNAGVSGDTSAGGLRRVDWVLRQEPDLLVVELGGNDGLRGQPLEEIESNLAAIVAKARAADARVLLLGVRIPTSYGEDYAEGFAAIYPRLAEREGIPFVPYFMEGVGGVPEMNLEDGLHPSVAGHERIAENVLPTLTRLLGELADRP